MEQRIEVRIARQKDSESICELLFGLKSIYGSAKETALANFKVAYLPSVSFAIESDSNWIWVAETHGQLIGFISFTTRHVLRLAGQIAVAEELFVKEEFRRIGIAKRLWEAAVANLKSKGISDVEVVTSMAHPGQRQWGKSVGLEWYSNIHRRQI